MPIPQLFIFSNGSNTPGTYIQRLMQSIPEPAYFVQVKYTTAKQNAFKTRGHHSLNAQQS
jgi:hypothetical protein